MLYDRGCEKCSLIKCPNCPSREPEWTLRGGKCFYCVLDHACGIRTQDLLTAREEFANRQLGHERRCIRCGGNLVAIRGDRANGTGEDWKTRLYHTTCCREKLRQEREARG